MFSGVKRRTESIYPCAYDMQKWHVCYYKALCLHRSNGGQDRSPFSNKEMQYFVVCLEKKI